MNRFTIVTPNFNGGAFLAQTIESVLANLRPGDEYFVIDGGSTDDSLAIIECHASQLTGWVSEPDRGYADAIAKGFGRGSGELLAWINSSDLLLPGALDCARRHFADPEVAWIYGDDYHIDEDGQVLFRSYGGSSNLRDLMLYGGWTPLQDACFWRRPLYRQVGGLDVNLRCAADFDLFLKLALNGKALYVPTAFSAYRRHAGQVSISRAGEYRSERMELLRRTQTLAGASPILRTAYFLWVRLRARLLQKMWNSRALRGRHIAGTVADCREPA